MLSFAQSAKSISVFIVNVQKSVAALAPLLKILGGITLGLTALKGFKMVKGLVGGGAAATGVGVGLTATQGLAKMTAKHGSVLKGGHGLIGGLSLGFGKLLGSLGPIIRSFFGMAKWLMIAQIAFKALGPILKTINPLFSSVGKAIKPIMEILGTWGTLLGEIEFFPVTYF